MKTVKSISNHLTKNKTLIPFYILLLILFIGGFFRFYNTPLRYGIGGDSGRDALMAKEAARQFQLPLTGSFSSLGPFTFGPWYYYILILSHFVIPSVWAPWIAVGLISLSMMAIMYKVGELLENKWFGLILASLTAFSPFQVSAGAAMVQHSLIGPLTALALYLFLEIWLKRHSPLFGILLGFIVGLAINMHYQAVSFLVLSFFFLFKRKKRFFFITTLFGAFFAALPLLFFELNNHWFNSQNIIRFFLYDQYRLWVPNRWLTYAFQFWPEFWSQVTGLPFILSFFSIAAFFIIFNLQTIRRKNSILRLLIVTHFAVLVTIVRYWRGERFFGYLQFFHPYIFLFLGYLLWWFLNLRLRYAPFLSVGVLLIILSFGFLKSREHLKPNSLTVETMKKFADLKENHPNQKISVYRCRNLDYDSAVALTLYLEMQKNYDEKGRKIGIDSRWCPVYEKELLKKKAQIKKFPSAGLKIIDLEEATPGALLKSGWQLISPKAVYEDVARWWFKLQP